MVSDNRKPKWFFYLEWVILSVISILIAWNIAWAIMFQIEKTVGGTIRVGGQTHITEDFLFFYVFLPVLGLVSGLLQYFLLRGYLPRMAWWVAATVLGWLLFPVVGGISTLFSVTASPALAIVVIAGAIAPQWILLRRRVRHAGIWVLAFILGWGVAFLLTDGTISSQLEVLAVVLLPPIAASIAWWLLLDKLTQRNSNKGNTPRNAPRPSVPLGAD
jgi:hypothetical protein